MPNEHLANMDTDKAATVIEQASHVDFARSDGGFGNQLMEMREHDPKAYNEIIQKATKLAENDTSPNKANALHNLELVDDLDQVQANLKSGNIKGLQDAVGKLDKDEKDRMDTSFASNAMTQGAHDAGYIANPTLTQAGDMAVSLHKPGSKYGINVTAEGAVPFDWQTKEDIQSANAQQILGQWHSEGPANDKTLLNEGAQALKEMAKPDAIRTSPTPGLQDVGQYLSIAYSHGYGGHTGLEAAQAMAADLAKTSGVKLKLSYDAQDPNNAKLELPYQGGYLSNIVALQK